MMKIKSFLITAGMMGLLTASAQVDILVDATQKAHQVSPMLYGIFFEDINHAADGGLYAELVANRSFEDSKTNTPCWSTFASPGADISAKLITEKLLNDRQHQALQLTINATPSAQACLVNEGFWGINAVMGQTYRLSFWARANYKGNVKVTLCDANGSQIYAETKESFTLNKKWTKYTASLTAKGNDPKAQLAFVFDGKGSIDLDVVSLFPPTFRDRENGCRPDLANMLLELRPKFMRFPGGCFVEGQDSPDNAFRWERTIGPIEEREGHLNRNWNYRTSDGLGFHEYLQLSEDLGAKPLFVVNVGIWHGGFTPVDELQPWIDECLNALEYANGDVTTKYGAMRAKDGHPAPFNIEYLEIGNENNQDDPRQQSDRYYERFKLFKDAVLAKYPHMHLIGNVVAWGNDNPKWNSSESVELLDEHYYRNPAWFTDNYRKYDTYERGKSKIYCGEYAVTQGFGKLGSLSAALGEAVFMMGMERNGDIVEMASYAPIFVNENNVAWQPDMIRFNSSKAMGTPSYYVQKLMAHHVGTQNVATKVDDSFAYGPDAVVSRKMTPDKSRVGYATWGTKASYQFVEISESDKSDKLDESDKGETLRGTWNVSDGVVSQTSMAEGCIYIDGHMVKTDHYRFKAKARKDGGNEGFMLVFNYQDPDNYCWLNLGGWGNTQHGLEQVVNGNKMQTATKRGRVEQGKWYDVEIEVDGDHVICLLDGKQVFDTQLKSNINTPGIFANAQMDDASGEMILKVINTGPESTTANIGIDGFNPTCGKIIRLASYSGDDENTLEQPTNVYPTEAVLPVGEKGFRTVIPAYSLNIFRLRK